MRIAISGVFFALSVAATYALALTFSVEKDGLILAISVALLILFAGYLVGASSTESENKEVSSVESLYSAVSSWLKMLVVSIVVYLALQASPILLQELVAVGWPLLLMPIVLSLIALLQLIKQIRDIGQ